MPAKFLPDPLSAPGVPVVVEVAGLGGSSVVITFELFTFRSCSRVTSLAKIAEIYCAKIKCICAAYSDAK
jgi:hypothetical protein